MGEPTGGSTGQPLFYSLPFGGMGAVCSKRDLMSDGSEFVGFGIKPDIVLRPSLQDIRNQKDIVLETALKELKK